MAKLSKKERQRFEDPVDAFEDALAAALGLRRDPTVPYAEWRETRVRFIEDAGEAADIAAVEVAKNLERAAGG